jgi:hypothetical protein
MMMTKRPPAKAAVALQGTGRQLGTLPEPNRACKLPA